MQAQDTSVQEALIEVNLAAAFIKRQRKDAAYQLFYSSVVLKAKNYTDDPVLPCYRRPPRCLDDGSAPHSFASPEDYYRAKYFEALNFVENEINRRFAQGSLALRTGCNRNLGVQILLPVRKPVKFLMPL